MAKAKQDAVEVAVDEVAKVADAADVAEPSGPLIRAVYGRMVDPLTGLSYDVAPCELLKMTGWVQSQLDAGKMELV